MRGPSAARPPPSRSPAGGPRLTSVAPGPSAALFTEDLFATGNDDDNRAAVLGAAAEDLTLAGVAVHGPGSDVDQALKGLRPHP
ncbi:DUF2000 family protein [Nocardiopsis sp. CA-288880]|uniref:DUF2000 family protein n=1 Tax=Nocardiopsis sp. CA-288880 TaxID=3239995 RepID=UPI003D958075